MKFLKFLWHDPIRLGFFVFTVAYLAEAVVNDQIKRNYRKTIASQRDVIATCERINGLDQQLLVLQETNSTLALQKMSFISSLVTMQLVTQKINHHEESLSWRTIWTNVVEQYNATNPAHKLDPEKSLPEDKVVELHKRTRL